ncbi:MAG: MFS transporter [Woeseiaceae bacterium]|nr:MFS transporter [Woeseiaceae bacterium]
MSDIRQLIEEGKLTTLQVTVFLVCITMNMLDGMDVLVIAYAAPAISADWSTPPQTLGTIFSAGLLGMTAGAMFLAPIADRIGRRNMIMICVLVMGVGILATAYVQTENQLIFLRFASGLGIGSMLATAATMAAEYAPNRNKNFIVSFVLSGYPLGATLSGFAAASIIPEYGWRAMFIAAGSATLVALPIVWAFLPESIDFLVKAKPRNALERVNQILKKMGHGARDELPAAPPEAKQASVKALFTHGRQMSTVWLWIAFFTSFVSLYFLTSWIPKLAESTGLSLSLAIYAGTVFNLGAYFGILSQGWLSQTFGLRRVISLFLIATAVLMCIFGYVSQSWLILLLFGLIGYGVQGGFVGFYTVAARMYPTEIRNTGIGWGIGAGRIGAIVGPKLGGTLIGMGLTLTVNFIIFSVPLVIAAVAARLIKSENVS